jgi:hypothetical protein
MRKLTKTLLLCGALLAGRFAIAQEQSSTTLLTEQKGIKVFTHYIDNGDGNKPIAKLMFLNTTNKPLTVQWTIKNTDGRTVVGGEEFRLPPGKLQQSVSHGNSLMVTQAEKNVSNALMDKSNTVQIDVK